MIDRIKNRFKSLKLWKKLLIIYLLISIMPLTCLCVFNAYNTTKLVKKQVSARLSEITNMSSNSIIEKINVIDSIVDKTFYGDKFLSAVKNYYRSPSNCEDINTFLVHTLEYLNTYFGNQTTIEFYSTDGNVISCANRNTNRIDYNSVSSLFSDNTYRYITCSENDVFIYYKTADLYNKAKDTGVLRIRMSVSSLLGKISLSGIDQYIFIIQNSKGENIYIDSNTANNYGDVVLNIFKKSENNIIYIHDDAFIYLPLYLEETDWYFYLLMPYNNLYLNFSQMLGYYVILSICCLIVVSIFSVLSSINISRRINNISSEMSIISNGEMEMIVDVDTTGDEIGELSQLFHNMMDRINSLVIAQYKSEIKLHEEQLKILQNQINPHFLYNCMDTINWRCILNNDTQTSTFANNLADFYRTCLNKGNTCIRLSDEIKNIRSYISLQLDMHDDSFVYEEEINPEIYEYQGVNLMLQPIVENAIIHGFEISDNQKGYLKITADFTSEARQKIKFKIFNNGKPIDKEIADEVMSGKKGYGISNVSNRIKLFFGESYGVVIRPESNGTSCVIEIPAKRWNDNA